jgi:hypothetical protein
MANHPLANVGRTALGAGRGAEVAGGLRSLQAVQELQLLKNQRALLMRGTPARTAAELEKSWATMWEGLDAAAATRSGAGLVRSSATLPKASLPAGVRGACVPLLRNPAETLAEAVVGVPVPAALPPASIVLQDAKTGVARWVEQLPQTQVASVEGMQEAVTTLAKEQIAGVRLVEPLGGGLHAGHTAKGIFKVKGADGKLLGFAKVETAKGAAAEYVGMEALQGVAKSGKVDGLQAIETMGAGRIVVPGAKPGEELVVIFQSPGPGKNWVKMMEEAAAKEGAERTKALAELQQAADQVARVLGRMHEFGPAATKMNMAYFEKQAGQIRDFFQKLLDSKAIKPADWRAAGFANPEEARVLIESVIARAMKNPGRPSFIHGDTNPGNPFILPDGKTVALIDTTTVTEQLSSAGKGIGPATRDVGSFTRYTEETMVELGFTEREAIELSKGFERAYNGVRPGLLQAELDALRFFELRSVMKTLFHTPEVVKAHQVANPEMLQLLQHRMRMLGRVLKPPVLPH